MYLNMLACYTVHHLLTYQFHYYIRRATCFPMSSALLPILVGVNIKACAIFMEGNTIHIGLQ